MGQDGTTVTADSVRGWVEGRSDKLRRTALAGQTRTIHGGWSPGWGRLTPDPTKCFLYKVFGGRGVHIRSRKERRRRCLAVLATSETKVSPLAVARRLHTFTPTTGDRSGGRGSTDSTQRDRHAPRPSALPNHVLRSFLRNRQATAAKP